MEWWADRRLAGTSWRGQFSQRGGQEGLGVWMESWSSAVFVVFVGQEEMRVAGGSSVGRGGGLGSLWNGELPLQWAELWT